MHDESTIKGKKILVVAPTPFFSDRGTHIRILEEALALEKRGHTVTIATYHIGNDLPEHLGSHIDIRRIRRLLFWYKKLEAGPDWQKIVLDLLLIKKTLFLARTKRPDVIHAHLHEGALIGFLVQKLLFWRKMALVVDFHGSLTKEMVSHSYLHVMGLQRIFEWVERFIDNLGDRAVTSSWNNKNEIEQIRKKNPPEVLLDGTRLSMFDGLPEKNIIRKEYGISEDAIVVTYTGAFIRNKGIEFFLEAIPEVAEKFPTAHFVLAGFPLDQIENEMRAEIFRERVTIVSPLPYFDLPKILKMSDIGVDPKSGNTKEASGKVLQYMGAGLAVACFDTENNQEYLSMDGGSFAAEFTSTSLAEAIGRLIENPELRANCGRKARERAQNFSWEKSAEQLEEMYQEILKSKGN